MNEDVAAREIVRRSERRLQAIIDAEPACVKLVSADGLLLDMNRAGLAMVGADDLAQLAGRRAIDLVHPDDRHRYLDMHRAASGGATRTCEFRIIGLNGQELWMESRSVPFDADGSGAASAVLSVTSDVTQRKKLEDQLRQAQRLEAVGRLAGGIAHDFNNLLTAILGNCDLATRALEKDHPVQDNLSGVREAGERAEGLIQQLLAFSRKQVLSPRVLDINQAVAGLTKILPRVIGEDITTMLDLDASLHHVRADATQLDQVLLNLALNARDAMPSGGGLTITTRNVLLRHAPVGQPCRFEPGPYVKLTFTDTGRGMDIETRNRVFEPFFTTKDTGTGLGLATAYGIVKQSRGFITVDSETGKGTTFTIFLPATMDALEPVEAAPDVIAVAGTETVLLVEDAAAVRTLAVRTLEAAGYTVLPASNGTEALAIAAAHRFDLLLTDVIMPGINGVQLASRLTRTRPDLRVLLMSGYDDESRSRRTARAPSMPLLQKPFSAATLTRAVRQTLDAPAAVTGAGRSSRTRRVPSPRRAPQPPRPAGTPYQSPE